MRGRSSIVLILLCGSAIAVNAQEKSRPDIQRPHVSLLTPTQRLLLAYPSEFVLLGFRRYEIEHLDGAERLSLSIESSARVLESDPPSPRASQTSPASSLSIPLGAEAVELPVFELVGRFVLMEALRFGYKYFRESTRYSSLTEFDYLELPQGTGMLRTSSEVLREALIRGEIQSLKTHEDRKEWERNAGKGP
jgi:hypothetical protein